MDARREVRCATTATSAETRTTIRPGTSIASRIIELTVDDHLLLQSLFDDCADYAVIHDGHPFGPSAALDEFEDLPPGATTADKFVHGLFGTDGPGGELIAVIESVRRYPDPATWWLGLLLVRQDYRTHGIGSRFYQWFEQLAADAGAQAIALSVIDANHRGRAFWERHDFELERTMENHPLGQLRHRVHVLRKRLRT